MATKKAQKETSSPSKNIIETTSSNQSLMITWILILVVVQIVISLALFFAMSSSGSDKINSIEEKVDAIDSFFANNVDGYRDGAAAPSGTQGTAAPTETVDPSQIDIEGEPFIGDVNAPVTIVEFSDYECPFCGRFFSDAYTQLKADYVDSGQVKFVFKDFPLSFHPLGEPASVAANCVQKLLGNEAYFEYHDTIFGNQNSLSVTNLNIWAQDLGVDSAEFESCTQDPTMVAEVQGDIAEGASLGVSGTPTLFINGEKLVGAQPYPVVKQAIENALNS